MALKRVRPSSLQIAELCRRAPWLAHHHPEETAATKHGSSKDALVTTALMGGAEPPLDEIEARAILAWVRKEFPANTIFLPQQRVTLIDPITGEEVTTGTADLLAVYTTPAGRRRLVVLDWKTVGQLYAGYLSAPDESLQQLAYMLAAGMELAVDEAQIILVCFDAAKLKVLEGQVHEQDAWWAFLDRIKAVPPIDVDGPQPTASKGDHCDHCWQRGHCSAYLLPAFDLEAEMAKQPRELIPFSEGLIGQGLSGGITEERALAALAWLETAEDVIKRAGKVTRLVKDQLETYARTRGPVRRDDGMEWGPVRTNGSRKGATVAELEAAGHPELIHPAEPGETFKWRKVG